MATMKVMLEDGSTLEVPAQRREVERRPIGGKARPSTFFFEPLPHPDYDFVPVIGGYRAHRKAT